MTRFALGVAALLFLTPSISGASAPTSGGGAIPGVISGTGLAFQITDSEYLNIGIESTETIIARLESVPQTIMLMVGPVASSATSTQITLTGFLPNTTYYKYEDSYHNLSVFISDDSGAYSYTQSISKTHLIFIQPKKSTKFIRDDATGGDCSVVGIWDSLTKTCVLTSDLNETVQIDSDGITLDGDEHYTTGSNTGFGIYLAGRTGITIKDLNIKNFSFGVFFGGSSRNSVSGNSFIDTEIAIYSYDSSSFNTFDSNTFHNDSRAFMLFNSDSSVIRGNDISADATGQNDYQAIYIFDSRNTTVEGNQITIHMGEGADQWNNRGIFLFNSFDNTIVNNTLSGIPQALFIYEESSGNKIYHNNFINNGTSAIDYSGMTNAFNLRKPTGGNYFDIFDETSEGCDDANLDSFCDAPYIFNPYFDGGQDNLPWTTRDGWKDLPPDPCASGGCASNVLFLPGIEGSRLYYRGAFNIEHQVWEPDFRTDIPYLEMNDDGTSKYQLYTKDIVDSLESHNPLWSAIANLFKNNLDTYGGFEQFMNGLVADGTVKEWRAYPYDWRYDVRDIVANGTPTMANGAVEQVYLKDVLADMASDSRSGKVTIVAHSNGGLLAKALAVSLGADAPKYIDRIILVGTPQWGTPAAIGALLHGDDFSDMPSLIINAVELRSVASGMSGAYTLIPSSSYFEHVSDPAVTFDSGGSLSGKFAASFGDALTSFSSLVDFIEDIAGLNSQAGKTNDLRVPLALSSALVDKATVTQSALDSWEPQPGITVTAIAGWGQDTVKTLAYTTKQKTLCGSGSAVVSPSLCTKTPYLEHVPVTTQDGDGTVVSPSAVGDTGSVLYFNAKEFENQHFGKTIHQNLTSATPVQTVIEELLKNKILSINNFIKTVVPIDEEKTSTLRISSHSPVNIIVTDADGNQSGVLQIPGTDFSGVKRDIIGSSVQVFDDEEYINVPVDGTYQIEASGYATGSARIALEAIDSDGVASTTAIFTNIPTAENSTITFSVIDNTPTDPEVDLDGDGVIDLTAAASSLGSDPLVYVRYMRAVVQSMTLSKVEAKTLDVRLAVIERQIVLAQKECKSKRGCRFIANAQKFLLKVQLGALEHYVEQQAALAVKKKPHGRDPQKCIPADQAGIIIGMINELETLL